MTLAANSEHIISYRLRLAIVVTALLSVFVSPLPAQSSPTIHLASDTKHSTAGYFRLSWNASTSNQQNIEFELQQSDQINFELPKTIYRGLDTARVISGKHNGDYYYRVRALESGTNTTPWSDTVMVNVSHHSLIKAIGFFTAGAIVFLMTLTYILRQKNQ